MAQALARFDKAKDRLSVELPEELEELRAKFTPEELRKVAEAYLGVAAAILKALQERAATLGLPVPGDKAVDKAGEAPLAVAAPAMRMTPDLRARILPELLRAARDLVALWGGTIPADVAALWTNLTDTTERAAP